MLLPHLPVCPDVFWPRQLIKKIRMRRLAPVESARSGMQAYEPEGNDEDHQCLLAPMRHEVPHHMNAVVLGPRMPLGASLRVLSKVFRSAEGAAVLRLQHQWMLISRARQFRRNACARAFGPS